MKRTTVPVAVVVAFVAMACSDHSPTAITSGTGWVNASIATGDLTVTNSNDAGPGSFRDAIEQANANATIGSIAFAPSVSVIWLQAPVTYTGSQALTIHGNKATLDGSGAVGSAFVADGGADISISALTVRNAPGQGIEVAVPPGASGTVDVWLENVSVLGNAGHGFLVNDQDDPLDINSGGSDASVNVWIGNSRFLRNGYSVSDRDGIRINEGGVGTITFRLHDSVADGNAADGIELDEKGDGDVVIDIRDATITRNGIFDPLDLDDGFDVDEAGNGSILGQVVASRASHNYEEGLDFNENDAGDLRVDLTDVEASFNREEGIDYEEDDDVAGGGDLIATMTRITTHGNGVDGGDGGLKIREKGEGNLDVTLSHVISSRNSLAGIHVRETEAGDARIRIANAVTNDNAGNGIEAREGQGGSITLATFADVTTSGNGGFGLSVDNGSPAIMNVKGGANGGGLLGGGAFP